MASWPPSPPFSTSIKTFSIGKQLLVSCWLLPHKLLKREGHREASLTLAPVARRAMPLVPEAALTAPHQLSLLRPLTLPFEGVSCNVIIKILHEADAALTLVIGWKVAASKARDPRPWRALLSSAGSCHHLSPRCCIKTF